MTIIVSFVQSLMYQLSKHAVSSLSSLVGKSSFHVTNSSHLSHFISSCSLYTPGHNTWCCVTIHSCPIQARYKDWKVNDSILMALTAGWVTITSQFLICVLVPHTWPTDGGSSNRLLALLWGSWSPLEWQTLSWRMLNKELFQHIHLLFISGNDMLMTFVWSFLWPSSAFSWAPEFQSNAPYSSLMNSSQIPC